MSNASNQIVEIWKDVEQHVRRCRTTIKGRNMCPDQIRIWQDAIILFYLCWYDIIQTSNPDALSRLRNEWLITITSLDLDEMCRFWKECDTNYVELLQQGGTTFPYSDFKHQMATQYPFAGALLGPAKRLVAASFNNDDTIVAKVRTLFCFLSRLSLPKREDLVDEAVEHFMCTDKVLENVQPTTEEQTILSSWFPRSSRYQLYSNWRPKHGPGVVAEGKLSLANKYRCLGPDQRLTYLFNHLDTDGYSFHKSTVRTSRLICVPKSVTKLRTICAEPCTLQWTQQGFLYSIMDYINSHKYLRRRIDLRDQQKNCISAWEGSIDGSLSTIDLSDASDSVSWRLIRQWFDKTALREIFFACRSTHVTLPSGENIRVNKFAPMGSALCFPTECIVFCAIVEAAIKVAGGDPNRSRYRVYGDDIIVEQEFSSAVIDRLEQNGFHVNRDKTYCSSTPNIFRESCGGEFLNGVDVCPLRLSRKFSGTLVNRHHPERIVALIDLCNITHVMLPSVRRYVISILLTLPKSLRPLFDGNGETGIFSVNPTNYHLTSQTPVIPSDPKIPWYQEIIYEYGGITIGYRDLTEDEPIRLFEWLRSSKEREAPNFDSAPHSVHVSPPLRVKWSTLRGPILG